MKKEKTGDCARSSGRRGALPESLAVRAWQMLPYRQAELLTEAGEPVRIIYPGRINDDEGPDLLDAVIATPDQLLIGAVEVHVRSSGWWSHGHHRDPRYNQVVLHAVYWHDSRRNACLENGSRIPTLALHKYTDNDISLPQTLPETNLNIPCRMGLADRNSILKLLDAAGEARFLSKAGSFREELSRAEAGQVLYSGIMGALGYSRNKVPFQELARRLPLKILETADIGISDDSCLLKLPALLLGTAGLLPLQRRDTVADSLSDKLVHRLEQIWAESAGNETMAPAEWRLFKVRPGNSPVRRIAGISRLLFRWRRKGLLAEAVDGIRSVAREEPRRLERMFIAGAEGDWTGLASRSPGIMLIGRGRASEIVVNVLLPFVFAWGKANSQRRLAGKALELFRRYPRLMSNKVEKQMLPKLGLNAKLVNSAIRQQGLLHIHQTRCESGMCGDCPLKN